MRLSVVVLCLVASSGVASAQNLVEVPAPNMGGACDDLDPHALADAIDREIAYFQKRPGDRMSFGAQTITVAEYASKTLAPLAAYARQGGPALCAALASRFRFFRNPGAGPGKFTAYNNPMIRASRTRHAPYLYPLYRRPKDPRLASLTTAEINKGALDGKGLELIYLADPTEVQAVHIEGSASVVLDDNTPLIITSDGNNGHPYVRVPSPAMPRDLKVPPGMTKVRAFFYGRPADFMAFWAGNPHYIFFKESKQLGGSKFGELTAGRSLAIDPLYVPQGAATWIRTDKPAIGPDGKVQAWISYGRVTLGQDTGSGIKGPGRVDVFFGTGDYAQQASAVTTRPGEIYVLLAK